MRAHAVTALSEPLQPIDLPEPSPQGGEVVIEVARCGVCHSDLHLHEGSYDLGGGKKMSLSDRGVKLPLVMGHEVLGTLVSKGPDAAIGDEAIGQQFLVYPWLGCGTCEVCQRGAENYCPTPRSLGIYTQGGYAERMLVPDARYLVDVTGIDPTVASSYACSGVTAYSALKKADIDRERDWLLILGVGGVGFNGLQIARGLGQKNIVVADIDADKRQLALDNGASVAVDPRDPDALTQVQELAGGIAAAVDFVGAGPTADFGIAALKKLGIYVAVGLFGGEFTLPVPLLVLRAITVRGSYVGNLGELREVIELVKSGKVAPMPVEEVPFDHANEALERLRAGQVRGRLVLAR